MTRQSDPNHLLRQLPLWAGILAGILLLLNRLLSVGLTPAQSRSDALGIIVSALLILTGLLWQRVQPRSPDAVVLQGSEQFDLAPNLPEPLQIELAWASRILLTNTATRAVVLWHDGQVLLRRGILPDRPERQAFTIGPILQRVLDTGKPVYLVSLSLYPGKVEFTYLPENTQGVICQPVGSKGVLILAANAPRSYTQQDEAWVAAIADKLANSLATNIGLPQGQG